MRVKIELQDDKGQTIHILYESYPIPFVRSVLMRDEINRAALGYARANGIKLGERGISHAKNR